MKTCSKCLIRKPFEDYFKCNKSKNGLQSQCKKCKVTSVKNSPSYGKFKRKPKSKEYQLAYYHKTKIARNISRRMRQSLKKERKSLSWTMLVDFTLEELKQHLEKMFTEEMCWDNYGSVWHIDHIKPVSSFTITSTHSEDFKKCWSLENLQPLLARDNLVKGSKIPLD